LAGASGKRTKPAERSIIAPVSANLELDIANLPCVFLSSHVANLAKREVHAAEIVAKLMNLG
jgi:hypothetical protein